MLYGVQLAELLVQGSAAEVENLRQALDVEREKVRALEVDLEATRERNRHYATAVTEEIERGECGSGVIFCK